jgi:membrane-associated phospholipid phosphatase
MNSLTAKQVQWLKRSTDIVVATYLTITALLVLWSRDFVPHWEIYTTLHFLLGALILWSTFLSLRPHAILSFLRDWYPVFAFPVLYKEVEVFAAAIGNWKLTEFVRSLETALFQGHPSLYLSEQLPWVPLSEFLHFSYLAYVFLIPGIGGYWYAKRRGYFFELVFLLTLTYLASYLFYILFPVDSPFYLSDPPGRPLAGHLFYQLVHFVSGHGGARGGAFPSSHVSVATVVFLLTLQRQPRLGFLISPVILGMIVATVYGRFHYTVDVIAGLALGFLIIGTYRVLSARPNRERAHEATLPIR